jgi:hypothetical protein
LFFHFAAVGLFAYLELGDATRCADGRFVVLGLDDQGCVQLADEVFDWK